MTLSLLVHPTIAHDLELLLAGWLLVVVVFLIAWGLGLIRADVRDLPPEGLHWRYTPEPTTCVVLDITEPKPEPERTAAVFFDQDVTA